MVLSTPIRRTQTVAAQLDGILRERIRNGQYAPGQRLPSEAELTTEFGVSRATVRTVLTRLTAEGLLLRKQGDGTYVNKNIRDATTHIGGLWEFQRVIESCGFQPSLRLVDLHQRMANLAEQEELGLLEERAVISLERVFLANERPVVLAENILLSELFHRNIDEKFATLPLRSLLHDLCSEDIAYAIISIHAHLLTASEAKHFDGYRQVGDALLRIDQIFYNARHEPLAVGSSVVDDQYLQLRMVQAW
jgi:GntR family transcriptional regulator